MTDASPGARAVATLDCAEHPCVICRIRNRVTGVGVPRDSEAFQGCVPNAVFAELPLELNLVGLRRKDTITSNRFDDRMALFFRLPEATTPRNPKVIEDEVLAGVERAVKAADAMVTNRKDDLRPADLPLQRRVRVVACNRPTIGPTRWVLAVYPISTDAGLVETRANLQTQIKSLRNRASRVDAQIAALTALDKAVQEYVKAWKEKAKDLKDRFERRAGAEKPTPEQQRDREALEVQLKTLQSQIERESAKVVESVPGIGPHAASTQAETKKRIEALNKAVKQLREDEKKLQQLESTMAAKAPKPADKAKAEKGAKAAAARLASDEESAMRAGADLSPAATAQTYAIGPMPDADRAEADVLEADIVRMNRGEIGVRAKAKPGFDDYAGVIHVKDDAWAGDGRALFPVGWYPNHFVLEFHHVDHPALRTKDYFQGFRVCSGRLFKDHYLRLIDWETNHLPRIRQLNGTAYDTGRPLPIFEPWGTKDAPRAWLRQGDTLAPLDLSKDTVATGDVSIPARDLAIKTLATCTKPRFPLRQIVGVERFRAEEGVAIVLERTGNGPSVDAWLDRGAGKAREPVEDDVQYVVEAKIGGTNIHRGHNVKVDDKTGVVAAGAYEGSDGVANWSTGCQVSRFFDDFNLFIRLCALTKRWRCAASATPPPSKETARLKNEAEEAQKNAAKARDAVTKEKEKAKTLQDKLDADATRQEATANDLQGKANALLGTARSPREKATAHRAQGEATKAKNLAERLRQQANDAKKPESASNKSVAKAEERAAKTKQAEEDKKAAYQSAQEAEEATLGACTRIVAGASPQAPGPGEAAVVSFVDPKRSLGRLDLWKLTRRYEHDGLRVCDIGGWCRTGPSSNFSYALAEMEDAFFADLEAAFAAKDASGNDVNPPWSGVIPFAKAAK